MHSTDRQRSHESAQARRAKRHRDNRLRAALETRKSAEVPTPEKAAEILESLVAEYAGSLGLPAATFDVRARGSLKNGARGLATEGVIALDVERAAPDTPQGREVLAHEMIHTAQSHLSGPAAPSVMAEREAGHLAPLLAGGAQVRPSVSLAHSAVAADRGGDEEPQLQKVVNEAVFSALLVAAAEEPVKVDLIFHKEVDAALANLDAAERTAIGARLLATPGLSALLAASAELRHCLEGAEADETSKRVSQGIMEFSNVAADAISQFALGGPARVCQQRLTELSANAREKPLEIELYGLLERLTEARVQFASAATAALKHDAGLLVARLARSALLTRHAMDTLADAAKNPRTGPEREVIFQTLRALDSAGSHEDTTLQTIAQDTSGPDPAGMLPRSLSASLDSQNAHATTIEPVESLPETMDMLQHQTSYDLTERIGEQAKGLAGLRNDVIPKTYDRDGFDKAYDGWLSFFSPHESERDPGVRRNRDMFKAIWDGVGMVGGMEGGLARGSLMATWDIGGAAAEPGQFNAAVHRSPARGSTLQRDESVAAPSDWSSTGDRKSARTPTYAAGEIYSEPQKRGAPTDERTSRLKFGGARHKRSGGQMARTRAAFEKDGHAAAHDNAKAEGIMPQNDPTGRNGQAVPHVYGMADKDADGEGWNYLYRAVILDAMGQPIRVMVDQKTVPPAVAQYMLALKQHFRTARKAHVPRVRGRALLAVSGEGTTGDEANPGGSVEKNRGVEPERLGNPKSGARSHIAELAKRRAATLKATGALTRRGGRKGKYETAGQRVVSELTAYLDRWYKNASVADKVYASVRIAISEHNALMEVGDYLNARTLSKVAAKVATLVGGLKILSRLGPMGAAVSKFVQGMLKKMGMRGDVATLMSMAIWFLDAQSAGSFSHGRRSGFIAKHIGRDLAGFVVGMAAGAALGGVMKAFKNGRTPREVADQLRQELPPGELKKLKDELKTAKGDPNADALFKELDTPAAKGSGPDAPFKMKSKAELDADTKQLLAKAKRISKQTRNVLASMKPGVLARFKRVHIDALDTVARLAKEDLGRLTRLVRKYKGRAVSHIQHHPVKHLDDLEAALARDAKRVTEMVPGAYRGVDPTATPKGWTLTDSYPIQGSKEMIRTDIVAPNGATGHVIRSYNPRTRTLEMKEAFFDKEVPRFISTDVPVVPGRGTPTSAFITMRQMRALGADVGAMKTVHMRDIQNIETICHLHFLQRRGIPIEEAILQTHSVKYAETPVVQSGHDVKSVSVQTGYRTKLGDLTDFIEARTPSKKIEHDRIMESYGLSRDTEVLISFDITLNLAPKAAH